ncbi:uncharacterized protein LOC128552954 [Mercenaria mercenaria]|uniref:uncharacterized protein LOC128552954 n=1 Tax=Mercenaria mercenaria TaxID=6596 RepID=UPI00234F181F|nr:uncharacterized protein LOC128552954 [Mercenaria mercenaria]
MATTVGNKLYLRYMLLLGKGGLLVLRRMIAREVARSGQTLEQILLNNRRRFNRLMREQQLKLYPTAATVNANVETWDISLLYHVLTKLFKNNLTLQERSSVNVLKTSRDEIQGHPDEMSMDANDFRVNFDDMDTHLTQLTSGLGQETADEIQAVIESSKSESIDITSSILIQNVKDLNEFKTSVITELEREFGIVHSQLSNINNQLKDIGDMNSQQTELQGENFNLLTNISTVQSHLHEDVLDVKNTTTDTNATLHSMENNLKEILTVMKINANTAANQEKISQLLYDHVQAIQREDSAIKNDEIKRRIDSIVEKDPNCKYQLVEALIQLLNDVNHNPEAQVGQVSRGSVRLAIRCSSMGGLLRHMGYMESTLCRQRLGDISMAVRSVLQISCSISWMIEPDSLLAFLKYSIPHHKAETAVGKGKEIFLPVHYTSLKGLTHIWNLFQEGAIAIHMKRISTILTESFGEDVKVSISIDSDQFMKAVYEANPVAVGGKAPTDLDLSEFPAMLTYKHFFDIDDTMAVDENETLMIAIHTAVDAYFAMTCIAKCCEVAFLFTLLNLAIMAMQNWLLLLQYLCDLEEQGYLGPLLTETEEEDETYEDISSDSESEEDDESD